MNSNNFHETNVDYRKGNTKNYKIEMLTKPNTKLIKNLNV